jgi:hypothetical protein
MAQTVGEILAIATDSVTLINEVNAGTWDAMSMSQSDTNDMVQRNVKHLEAVLLRTPVDEEDDTPDVAGWAGDKSSYEQAIITGKSYIENNS